MTSRAIHTPPHRLFCKRLRQQGPGGGGSAKDMIPWELVDSDGAKARFRLGDGAADGGSSVQVNTRKGSTEMLVCQIVYYMVPDSNGFDTVSGRKEGSSA